MKKLKTIVLALACFFAMGPALFSQQANIWHFGRNAGLDFTSTTPVAITGGALNTNEGCATICDNSGNLLFYTDGVKVWDATHTQINVSNPLMGHPSSTQSAVIVPKPGSANRYYIFTQYQHGMPSVPCINGLNYTEVDVTGSVVSLVTGVININLLTCSETTEKITAACHANGTDYWAVTVKQNGDFVSWPVTSTGVGTAVISSGMATPCNSTGAFRDDRVGYMKISSQGTHLVLGRRQTTSVNEIFTFNNSTGQVTSNLGTYHTGTVYGVEFSGNGNYFYTTEDYMFTKVVQYDIPGLTPTTLYNSTNGVSMGALQMGPDGNIYVANGYEGTDGANIDRITNVNTSSPTYVDNYITLPSGTASRLGLPDFVACFTPTPQECLVDAQIQFAYNPERCAYEFTDASTFGTGTQIVSWLWTFGDGTSSTEQNPVHHYETPGSYTVCLTVTGYDGEECCVSKICVEIEAHEECHEPCNIQHDFNWTLDECEECQFNFNGILNFSNRQVVAWIWDFGDGGSALGQNASHVYTAPGVYNVCLTVIARSNIAGEGCCIFKICYDVDVRCEGKPQDGGTGKQVAPGNEAGPAPGETLKAYPNPANTNLHIEYTVPSEQQVSVQMMDYNGKIIWEETKISKGIVKRDIDISAAPAGIYLLIVDGETFNMVEKIQIVKY